MDNYEINIKCRNCEYTGKLELPKGTPVNSNMECPNCGCSTAEKDRCRNKDILPFRPIRPCPRPYIPWDVKTDKEPWRIEKLPYISKVGDRPPVTVTFIDGPRNGCSLAL